MSDLVGGIILLGFQILILYFAVKDEIRASERRVIEEIKKREATNAKS